jgi:RecA-family ATPase
MPRYICSLPNTKKAGRIPELITDDLKKIEDFARRWDQPGRGVYDCVGVLKEGARRRSREVIAELVQLHVDIDFKDIVDSPDNVDRRLRQLPLLPTEIRNSGGGRHVIYRLKEPIDASEPEFERACDLLKRLTACLCGDPAPAHPAALLRRPGTHNTKREKPVLCEVMWRGGDAVDITEIETLLDRLQGAPLFARGDRGNGHDRHSPFEHSAEKTPVDVAERLAAMQFKGRGESAMHTTQLACTASLLRAGCTVDHVVAEVLEATRAAVAGDARTAKWNWATEELEIRRMCTDFISNLHPELSVLLPDELRTKFEAAIAAGKTPKVVYARHIGWHVRSFENNEPEPANNPQAKAAEQAPEPGKTSAPFVLRPFVPFDPAGLPPRQWLYGRHYQRRTVSGTVAPGGFGKTTLCMVEAVAMATCRNLLGEQPEQRLRCWYHNGEDSLEELNRRLAAICQHFGIPQEELSGWFFMTSGNEVPLRVAKGYSNLVIDTRLIKHITEAIGDNQIDAATLDPLVTLHGVPENDTGKMDTVVRIFASITDTQDCAIELSHHTRKLLAGSSADYVVDDMRGAGSMKDAMRAVRMLNLMTKTDAESTGIPEHERPSYFRVDRVKANNAPPASAAIWRRFVNVDLPNGDEVGVVVPWEFPGQGAAPSPEKAEAERKAEEVFLRLLDRFVREERNVSDRGPQAAPTVFAKEAEAKGAKLGKAVLADAMRRLFAAGRIRIETYGRPSREYRRIVRV